MTRKVLLIDVDSTLPNLALMKLSAYHRQRGDEVVLSRPGCSAAIKDPDIIYASIVFKRNRHLVDGLRSFYPDAEIVIGGSGYDLSAKLPAGIEALCPDYSLYPGMDYSMGFTSRGCIRHCYFCVVPQKEGAYRPVQHPSEFVRHDRVKLLDNNWYADPEWFFETSDWLIENGVQVDVTQGMDVRLLTPEIVDRLKRLTWWRPFHFAFDDERDTQAVLDGINMLQGGG